jgi:hypothetical protein
MMAHINVLEVVGFLLERAFWIIRILCAGFLAASICLIFYGRRSKARITLATCLAVVAVALFAVDLLGWYISN